MRIIGDSLRLMLSSSMSYRKVKNSSCLISICIPLLLSLDRASDHWLKGTPDQSLLKHTLDYQRSCQRSSLSTFGPSKFFFPKRLQLRGQFICKKHHQAIDRHLTHSGNKTFRTHPNSSNSAGSAVLLFKGHAAQIN